MSEEKMSWEADAENAVVQRLTNARWDVKNRVVYVPDLEDSDGREDKVAGVETLREILCDAYMTAWNNSVPFDGGAPVFEPVDDFVDEELAKYEEKILQMNWVC